MTRQEKIKLITSHLEGWKNTDPLSAASYAKSGRVSGSLLTALIKMLDEHEEDVKDENQVNGCVYCTSCSICNKK